MDASSSILLAQGQGGGGGGVGGTIVMVVYLAIIVVTIVGLWKVFDKAGQPGWGCIIPIYNVYLLCKIAGKPGWWVILFFIPLVNIVIGIILPIYVAQNFGKGAGFGIGLIFLPFVFYPILGFGDAQYRPAAAA